MSDILSGITTIVSEVPDWISAWIGTMTTTVTGSGGTSTTSLNLIGMFVLIPVVGLGVGLLKRLTKI